MKYGNYNWWCGSNSWGIDVFWGFPYIHGPFGFILSLLFGGIVIWALIKVAQAIFSAFRQQKDSYPLMILKRRYASGELSLDEFSNMKKQL